MCGARNAAVAFLRHKAMPGTPMGRGFPRVLNRLRLMMGVVKWLGGSLFTADFG